MRSIVGPCLCMMVVWWPNVTCARLSIVALLQMCERVEGASFDLEYDTSAMKEMANVTQFSRLSAVIERAVHLKKQLEEKERQAVAQPPPQAPPPIQRNYGTIKPITPTNTNTVDDLEPKSFA